MNKLLYLSSQFKALVIIIGLLKMNSKYEVVNQSNIMTVALSKTDIESFNNDGVVVLRGVFKEWIDILIRVAEFHINNPSSSALVHQD